jgi:transposase InsO family protein
MTHVRTSPYYPQSNGDLERWYQSIKRESIRPRCPLLLEDARDIAGQYVQHYNTRRLHSAIGSVTPADKLAGPRAGNLRRTGPQTGGRPPAAPE